MKILAAFNHAKVLVSNLNILNALKKHTAFELHDLSKNIFDSVRLKINLDNYSIAHSDSSSNSESDYDDETIEGDEINNDLFNFSEKDQDMTKIQDVDGIKTNKMNFNGIRIFDSINPALNSSYFQMQINKKVKGPDQKSSDFSALWKHYKMKIL
ncbi:unnamed protein product [Rotaria sordida]|uniref:Uncharacterized protein n=1 Tax=Rotaria sordida TaxID=392033 RepID=A0A814W741_9BILA|nr:unnamed protein product [Rotaria sordida]CAF3777663.1 unnamed protein product [Rotaria sordida]